MSHLLQYSETLDKWAPTMPNMSTLWVLVEQGASSKCMEGHFLRIMFKSNPCQKQMCHVSPSFSTLKDFIELIEVVLNFEV